MKKIFASLAFILAIALPAQAKDFKEGEHYDVIAKQASASPQVAEYFSYFCPHCYSFEPIVLQLKQSCKKYQQLCAEQTLHRRYSHHGNHMYHVKLH